MDRLLSQVALILSFLLEGLALPPHAFRLMALRLLAKRTSYQISLELEQELDTLKTTINLMQQMEQKLTQMDLSLTSSQQVALTAFQAGVTRIRQRLSAELPHCTKEPQEKADEEGRPRCPGGSGSNHRRSGDHSSDRADRSTRGLHPQGLGPNPQPNTARRHIDTQPDFDPGGLHSRRVLPLHRRRSASRVFSDRSNRTGPTRRI